MQQNILWHGFYENPDIIRRMAISKEHGGSLQLQDRDLALLRGLFECRVMTRQHIADIFFGGSNESAKKRLQKIIAAGYITERRKSVNKPACLFLSRKGLNELKQRGILNEYPKTSMPALLRRAHVSDKTIQHELAVMDVKAVFHAAFRNHANFSIREFSTWPLLHEFKAMSRGYDATEVKVSPDGFIDIIESGEGSEKHAHSFFLEIDRSGETQEYLVARAGRYLEYFRSGGFALRNGGRREDFKSFPFRVLMVCETAARCNNTAERLLANNPPILTHTWLTTFKEATSNPLGAIWMQPKDYLAITSGTQFEPNREGKGFVDRPQTQRDLFVESKVQKVKILET
jgi:Replication-relaxation